MSDLFNVFNHVTINTIIDGQDSVNLFGGAIPPVGATASIHRHKDTLPEMPDGDDDGFFDEDGFCHLNVKVVDVEYDITISSDRMTPERKATVRLESMR